MYQLSKYDAGNIVVIFLLFFILFLNWVGFLVLDKKIDKALERQGEINKCSYETNKEQSKDIRILKTDTEILMRLALENTYMGEEE